MKTIRRWLFYAFRRVHGRPRRREIDFTQLVRTNRSAHYRNWDGTFT